MGNCNTRLLMNGSRRLGATAAPAEEGEYDRPAQELLRSESSEQSTFVVFENKTDFPVKLYWINYEGHEIPYRTLAPGLVHRQQTFVTHPWTFKALNTNPEDVVVNHRRVVFPDASMEKHVLKKPEHWIWTTGNHQERFPRKFVETTQVLLMCYNKLRKNHLENLNSSSDCFLSARSSEDDLENLIDLGVFPTEIVLRIVELSAPFVPYILPAAAVKEVGESVISVS